MVVALPCKKDKLLNVNSLLVPFIVVATAVPVELYDPPLILTTAIAKLALGSFDVPVKLIDEPTHTVVGSKEFVKAMVVCV